MRGHDRRARWKQAVYAPRAGLSDGTRVLLLYLHDHMDARGIVSRPRSKVCADLGLHSARVTERLRQARDLGFLDTVRRGRPHVTAVYQAVIPALEVRQPYLKRASPEVRQPGSDEVRLAYLPDGSRGTPHRQPSSSTAERPSATPAVAEADDVGSDEKTHERAVSIDDPRSRRRESA